MIQKRIIMSLGLVMLGSSLALHACWWPRWEPITEGRDSQGNFWRVDLNPTVKVKPTENERRALDAMHQLRDEIHQEVLNECKKKYSELRVVDHPKMPGYDYQVLDSKIASHVSKLCAIKPNQFPRHYIYFTLPYHYHESMLQAYEALPAREKNNPKTAQLVMDRCAQWFVATHADVLKNNLRTYIDYKNKCAIASKKAAEAARKRVQYRLVLTRIC